MSRTQALGLLLVALLVGSAAAQDKPVEVPGKIESVVIYRGQALVTRLVEADLPDGASEVVVTELPGNIVPDSLFAGSDAQAHIRAVRYRTRAISEEPREEVRKIDQQAEQVQQEIRASQERQKLLAQKQAYLASLEGFTAEKVKDEAGRGALNFETIKAMTTFLFEQRTTLSAESLKLAEEARDLQAKAQLLARQREELTRGLTRTAREALLFVDRQGAAKTTIRLSYLVTQASWSPTYNLRAQGEAKQVNLEYNAIVQQMSGEDWSNVKLTLSTASPTMVAEAPILVPLWVVLGTGPAGPAQPAGAFYARQQDVQYNLAAAARQRGARPGDKRGGVEGDWNLNEWANRLQMLDLAAGRDVLLAGRMPDQADTALSVNYELPGRLTVASRNDQQMIQIALLELPAEFYYLAVPMLTPYVYQQADVTNTSKVALLSGPVDAYMDGQFMGTGRIPMAAKGQRFVVGFGIESQLRAGRELADKTDRVQGGNRELTFKYRLLISNYMERKVQVRVMDRLPDPVGSDIRVTLLGTTDPVSEDKVYQRTMRKQGILRWEIDVPAKSFGATAKTLEYEFKMEFDRNMHVAEPAAPQVEQQKQEFQKALDSMQYLSQ